jgi:hypothetical protein
VSGPARVVGDDLFPTYRWLCAPAGLATRRQLAALGLRPGRQPIAGQIIWRRGKRVAYLFRIDRAAPKRPATAAQLAALAAAMRVRRTCPDCGRDIGYCLPRRWPACLDCQDAAATGTGPYRSRDAA